MEGSNESTRDKLLGLKVKSASIKEQSELLREQIREEDLEEQRKWNRKRAGNDGADRKGS